MGALAISAALALGAMPVAARAQEAPVHVSIPAQSLGKALLQLGEQTSLQIFFSQDLVNGLNAPAVSGNLPPEQALQSLLRGTAITYRREGNNVTLAQGNPSSVAQMPAIAVTGDAVQTEAQRLNPPTMVGSKTPLTQREIPQSVSVVTQEQIQAQNLDDMYDALRKTPGMVVTPYRDERVDLFSRGFPVDSMQLDGLPLALNAANGLLAPDLAMYDHVETLRGPAGLYNGFGGPGGTINLVRKRPLDDLAASAELRLGTNHEARGMADLSTPLNQDKTVRARIVGSYESTDLYQDSTYKRPGLLYGIVEADLTPATKVDIGGSYQRLSMRSMALGYPAYSNYQLIQNPKAYLGGTNDYDRYESNSAFFDVEHRFGNDWKFKLAGTRLSNTADMRGSFPCCGGVDPATGITRMSWGGGDSGHNTQDVLDMYVDGPFELAGRQHHLTLGMNYQRVDDYLRNIFGVTTATANLFDPVELPPYNGPLTTTATTTVTTQYTTYGNARFKLADPLTLVLGGNVMWWRASATPDADQNPFGSPTTRDQVNGHLTPYGGLIYDLNQTYSAYASYSTVFTPQSARDKNGELIKPMQGNQYEVGLKGTYLDGKLNTGLALFQLTQENRAVADPTEDPFSGISIAQGKARSRGLEASLSGEVYPGLSLYTGYAYTSVRSLGSDDGGTEGIGAQTFSQIAPKHSFKLWADYRLPGSWSRYSVGAGLNVSSSYYSDDGVAHLTQPGYMTADLKLGYVINEHMDVSLYIANIFNRRYYESIGSTWNQNFPGAPRTAMLTLRWKM